MAVPPSLPTTWVDGSARPTNLAAAINDLANALNVAFPGGLGQTSYIPALTATTTNPTLGTGGVQVGTYQRIGGRCFADFAIKFGSSGAVAGSGAYRISLPVPCTTAANTNSLIVGYGHVRNPNEGFIGLGPGAYRGVTFHNAPSVTTSVAGIVLNANLPNPSGGHLTDAYTVTNGTTDRTLDVTGNTTAQGLAVLGTLLGDLDEAFKNNLSDNASDANPWVWAAGFEIIGTLNYPC